MNSGDHKGRSPLLSFYTISCKRCRAGWGGHVYTTEILKPKIELAKQNFKESGLENMITLFEKDIKNVLRSWRKSLPIDLIFMDADKENYLVYYEMMLPLLRTGGLIIVDNAGRVKMPDGSYVDCKHIHKFVEIVKSDKRVASTYLDFDNGILLAYKK